MKVAPKKVAVKKAASTAARKPRIVAPKKFEGYSLTTHPTDDRYVRFGCGDVTVKRDDLVATADFFENVTNAKAIARKVNENMNNTSYSISTLMRIAQSKEAMAIIKAIVKNPGLASLMELRQQSSSRRSFEQLLAIEPKMYRAIAAVPKTRTSC